MQIFLLLLILGAQVYLGTHFLRYAHKHLKQPLTKQAMLAAALLGVVALGLAVVLEIIFVPAPLLFGVYESKFADIGWGAAGAFIEEGSKLAVVGLFLYRRPYFRTAEDGLLLFGIAGFSFGILEDAASSLQSGVLDGLVRIITGAPAHVAYAALIGYALGQRKEFQRSWWYVLAFFGLAVGLHTLWDYSIGRIAYLGHVINVGFIVESVFMVVMVNAIVFELFSVAKREDGKRILDDARDHSVCKQCGFQNHLSNKFCSRCGAALGKVPGLSGVTPGAYAAEARGAAQPASTRKFFTAFMLAIFLGWLGADRFYLGKGNTGLLKFLTLGGLGVWYIVDVLLLALGVTKDVDHRSPSNRAAGLKPSIIVTLLTMFATSGLLFFVSP